MGTQQSHPTHEYHARKYGQQRPMYPLSIGFLPYGEHYAYSSYLPYSEGQPYGNFPQYSSQTIIRVCQ